MQRLEDEPKAVHPSHWSKICPLSFGKQEFNALLDTGADVSLISYSLFKTLSSKLKSQLKTPRNKLQSVTGTPLDIAGTSNLKFRFGNRNLVFKFHVVRCLPKSLILGSDFLSTHNVHWDFQKRTVSIGSSVVLLKDKRNNESVNLVHASQTLFIPPKTTSIIPCSLPKQCKGEYIISALDNIPLFHEQPGPHIS